MHPAALFLADMRARFTGRMCSAPLMLHLQATEVENLGSRFPPAPANDREAVVEIDLDVAANDEDDDDESSDDALDNARSLSLPADTVQWTPQALARMRLDERGRMVRRWAEPEHRREIAIDEAVRGFLAWLREEAFDGLLPAADIVGPGSYYEIYCAQNGLAELDGTLVLNVLGSLPGIDKTRRRLNAPHLLPMQAYLTRTRRPCERVWLYRIDGAAVAGETDETLAEAEKEPEPVAATAMVRPRPKTVRQADLFAEAA